MRIIRLSGSNTMRGLGDPDWRGAIEDSDAYRLDDPAARSTILSAGALIISGAAKAAGAEVGVGISGIAGPGGGTEKKPVGMVCFGFTVAGKELAFTRQFGPMGRSAVREASVEVVFDTLIELLKQ